MDSLLLDYEIQYIDIHSMDASSYSWKHTLVRSLENLYQSGQITGTLYQSGQVTGPLYQSSQVAHERFFANQQRHKR